MAKLNSFTFITMNGFFKGPQDDISWHKNDDPEKDKYAVKGIQSGGTLIFGRITYEMMASQWTSPEIKKSNPQAAEGMTNADKIVFSRTLKKADWKNTRLISGDLITEVKKLKKESGKDMVVLGSGTILSQLAQNNLIDKYLVMLDPVAIGTGTPIFSNVHHKLNLKLIDVQKFESGVLVLTYEPVKK